MAKSDNGKPKPRGVHAMTPKELQAAAARGNRLAKIILRNRRRIVEKHLRKARRAADKVISKQKRKARKRQK